MKRGWRQAVLRMEEGFSKEFLFDGFEFSMALVGYKAGIIYTLWGQSMR